MIATRFFSLFIACALFVAPLPLSAIAQEISTNISQFEADIIDQNPEAVYIDLSKERSNIGAIIAQLSDLDENDTSLLHELNKHIKNGFSFAEYNAVIETLEYATSIINKNYMRLQSADAEKIAADLDGVIESVINGSLKRRPTLTIDDNIDVLGHSTFEKHVKTKEGIHVEGKLKVGKKAKFKENVTIEGNLIVYGDAEVDGTLSVTDLVVTDCIENLCVDNLTVTNCIANLCVDSLSVTDLAVANCMTSLCVNTLSVVDESISGTLSANDAYITNATIDNLTIIASVLDSVIENLTVTNVLSANDAVINTLSVTNCIQDFDI